MFEHVRVRSVSLCESGHQTTHVVGPVRRNPSIHPYQWRKIREIKVLDLVLIEAGAFYVMDRGYLDFRRLFQMHHTGTLFVTRVEHKVTTRRIYTQRTDGATGTIRNQFVLFKEHHASQDSDENLRRIRYKAPITRKTLVLLTNNFALKPLTIAALYKNRWQVKLLFKWIKQHMRIKKLQDNSENAVKTQIWCAVSTCILITIVKNELQIDTSLYTLLKTLSVSVLEQIELSSTLQGSKATSALLYSIN